jgi:hypothetical protein
VALPLGLTNVFVFVGSLCRAKEDDQEALHHLMIKTS